MSKFKEKAEAQTMQVIGQMIGDDQLVEEGKEQSRKAEAGFDEPLPSGKTRLHTMPKENDLEGAQDQGGKHGGQKGMPKPEPRPAHGKDQMSAGRNNRAIRSARSMSAGSIKAVTPRGRRT